MRKSRLKSGPADYPLIQSGVLVIGSGAAGLNAAIQVFNQGVDDVVLLTEQWGGGTSSLSGSDKQTYYRLDPWHPSGDSVHGMAESLCSGGCMHGDIALAEAAGSLPAFFHLIQSGVPFPQDRYGRYPGYQTDHDERGRGTSAGPLTSRLMFNQLAARVVDYQIPIQNNRLLLKILTEGVESPRVTGAIVLNLEEAKQFPYNLEIYRADYVILATGGPGELFSQSVWPEHQYGASGWALEAGAELQNLTEFQFGLASLNPRWNLSGSYQQVVPRYYSTDQHETQHDFLSPQFSCAADLSRAIFLKGYQWPFDPAKLTDAASSRIDLLVYHEMHEKGRQVWMDFRHNPLWNGEEMQFDSFDPLVISYLEKSGARLSTPVERLGALNQPALDLYQTKGVQLGQEALPIGVCAQHGNGGITGDIWWESRIQNLFAVGEANGSHGVYRPGGSALNAGQVGGMRAAMMIAYRAGKKPIRLRGFSDQNRADLDQWFTILDHRLQKPADWKADEHWKLLKNRSSRAAGIIRSPGYVRQALYENREQQTILEQAGIARMADLVQWFRLHEQLLLQEAVLESVLTYLEAGGQSRGSYLVLPDELAGTDKWIQGKGFTLDDPKGFTRSHILVIRRQENKLITEWRAVSGIPDDPLWFETVWKDFRVKKHFES